jgi:hypothetical protein
MVMRKVLKSLHEAADMPNNPSQCVVDPDIPWDTGKNYDNGKVSVHLHFRGYWRGESQKADLCAVFERAIPEVPEDHPIATGGYTRILYGRRYYRDQFVFINPIKVVTQPQRMVHWTVSVVRLRLFNQPLSVEGQSLDKTLATFHKLIPMREDRELGARIQEVRASERFCEFPCEMVEGGPCIVNTIPDQQTPLTLREWLGDRDAEAAFRPIRIELDGNRVGFRFEKETDFLFQTFQVLVGPVGL